MEESLFNQMSAAKSKTVNTAPSTDSSPTFEEMFNARIKPGVHPAGSTTPMGQYGQSMFDEGIVPGNIEATGEIRAQNQPSIAKLGSGLANAVTGTLADIVSDASYLLDFEQHANLINGTEKEFGNWLSQAMDKFKEATKLPVYRTKESEGFSPLSAGWWGDAMPSIVSTVSMIVPTNIAVRGLGAAAKAMGGGKLINAITKSANLVEGTTQLGRINDLTAGIKGIAGATISRYMENTMEGAQTFQDTYSRLEGQVNPATGRFFTEEERKQIAGEAARDNWSANIANLAFDIPQHISFFKSFDKAKGTFSKLTKDAVSEAGEEAYQFITNKETQRNALIQAGVVKDDFKSLAERIADYAKDGEFWTSVALGGLGGIGFGVYGISEERKNAVRQKAQDDFYNGLYEQHKAIVLNDEEKYNQVTDKQFTDAVLSHIQSGTLDRFKSDLLKLKESDNEFIDAVGLDDNFRQKIDNRLKDLNFIDQAYSQAILDDTKSNEVKGLELSTLLSQRLSEKRLGQVSREFNQLLTEDQIDSNIPMALHELKRAKLEYLAIKDIPVFKQEAADLKEKLRLGYTEIRQDNDLFPDLKTNADIDKAMQSSMDNLLINKAKALKDEELYVKAAKEALSKLNTSEGRKEIEAAVAERKAEAEKTKIAEEKAAAKEAEKAATEEKLRAAKTQQAEIAVKDQKADLLEETKETLRNTNALSGVVMTDEELHEAAKAQLGMVETEVKKTAEEAKVSENVAEDKDFDVSLPDIESESVQKRLNENELNVASSEEAKSQGTVLKSGYKTRVVNFAYLSYEYTTEMSPNGEVKKTVFNEEGKGILTQGNVNPLALHSPDIAVGTKLVLFVDRDYNNFEELAKNPDTVPIAIATEDNPKQIIAYVHDMNWVSKEADNVSKEQQEEVEKRTKEIRDAVLNSAEPIKAVITGKSMGVRNRNSKGFVNGLAETFGPQDETDFAKFGESHIIVATSQTTAKYNNKDESVKNIANRLVEGMVYMEVPTPVKETYFAAPLKVAKLSELGLTDIIIKAIEIHLSSPAKPYMVNNKNLATPKGLFDFISELTFVGKGKKRNALTFDMNLKGNTLFLNIGATLDRGFDADAPVQAKLDRLNSIKEQLKAVLDGKYFNVSLERLSSKADFNTFKIDGNDLVIDQAFRNYSDYLAKNVLKTDTNPEIDNSTKERSFFHQPVIAFDLSSTTSERGATPELEAEDTEQGPTEGLDDELPIDMMPRFEEGMLKYYKAEELTLEQQNQIIGTIISNLTNQINEGKGPKEAFEIVRGKFATSLKAAKGPKEAVLKMVVEGWEGSESFIGFRALTELKLAELGTTIEDEYFESEEGVTEKRNYSESATFGTNPKSTASANLKRFLATIPVVDKQGKFVPSILGTKTYYDFNMLYNQLMTYLADTPVDSILTELQELADKQIQFKEVVNRLMTGSEQQRNEFISNFRKRYSELTTNAFDANQNGVSVRIRNSNLNSATALLIDRWKEAFKDSLLFYQDEAGNSRIDIKATEAIYKRFKELSLAKEWPEAKLQELSSILKEIGITVSPEALADIKRNTWVSKQFPDGTLIYNSNKELQYRTFQSLLNDKLAYLFKEFTAEQEEDVLFEDKNPFRDETGSLRVLANAQKKYEESLFSSSFRDAKGNSIFSYNNPTHLTDQILKLTTDDAYLKELQSTAFASKSDFIKQLLDPKSDLSKVFNVTYLDALKKVRSREEATSYSDMSNKLREFTRLGAFQNQGKKTAHIFGLTFSDKDLTALYEVPKVSVDSWKELNSPAMNMLMNLAISELERIKLTKQQIEAGDKSVFIEEYHTKSKAGLLSFLFKDLNSSEHFFADGQLRDEFMQRTIGGTKEDLAELRNIIIGEVNKWVEDKKATWKQEGIYTDSQNNLFDKSYVSGKGGIRSKISKSEDLLQYAAEDYVINYAITTGNLIQLIHGDIALAGKKGARTEGYLRNSLINYYKRMAKDVAPKVEMLFPDRSFNTLYIKDVEYANEYSKKFGKKINGTDAQEITTLQEHIDVMYSRGLISDKLYNSISDKIDIGENYSLTGEELSVVLQPMKPVHVNMKIQNGINKVTYIKTAAYPLIPELTRGTNMDKLRVMMEKAYIQRAVFTSGVKMGIQNSINMYSEAGEFVLDEQTVIDNKNTLSREGFGIQQDNPFKEEDLIRQGTQQRKLLFLDISEEMEFKLNGKAVSKKDLKSQYDSLHLNLLNTRWNKLLERFNVVADERGNYNIVDLKAFQGFIKEEALARGWNPNELISLDLNENGTFKLPLMFNPQTERIESLLTSLVNNNVVRNKLPGRSLIQASSVGYEAEGANIFAAPGLAYQAKDSTGYYSEAIIAWNFKDNQGNTLSYERYVNEDGSPKDNVPKELLYFIGYRIPTQSHSSMARFKIKRFLPPNMGDIMLVPAEITLQMGSDFDVDKMNIYQHEYVVDKGEILVATSVNNDIIDINHAILSDEKMQNIISAPLEFEDFKAVADKVNSILEGTRVEYSVLYDRTSDKAFEDGKSGKILTALTAQGMTRHQLFQDTKAYMKVNRQDAISIQFLDEKGELYSDKEELDGAPKTGAYVFGKVKGFTGKKISDVKSSLHSVSVDNAKEQLLNKANLNKYTYGVADLIAETGFDESFFIPFLAQESIREYVVAMERLNDPTQDFSQRVKKQKIVEDLLDKYEVAAGESIDSLTAFSKDELLKLLNESNEAPTKNYMLAQAQILYNFLQYDKVAGELLNMQNAIQPETGGIGKAIVDSKYKENQIDNLLSGSKYIAGFDAIIDNHYTGKVVDVAIREGNNIWRNLFPYFNEAYSWLESEVQQETGRDRVLNADALLDLYKEVKSALYTKPGLISRNLYNDRKALFIDEFTIKEGKKIFSNKSLAQRLSEYKGENKFFRKLTTELAVNSGDVSSINYLASAVEESGEAFTNSLYWEEALNSSNEREKQLAVDLVNYALLSGGVMSRTSFVRYIPTSYLTSKAAIIADTVDFKNEGLFEYFLKQYFQHQPWKARQLKTDLSQIILSKEDRAKTAKQKQGLVPDSFQIGKATDLKVIDLLVIKEGRKVLPTYLSLKTTNRKTPWAIYEYVGVDEKGFSTYMRVNTLGSFGIREYSLEASNDLSVVASNNVKQQVVPKLQGIDVPVKGSEKETSLGALGQSSNIIFEEEQTSGYRSRTIKNASADATIAIAADFNSAGERLTKSSVLSQKKLYLPVSTDVFASSTEVAMAAGIIAKQLNSLPQSVISLNIAGNGIYTLKGKLSQKGVDEFTYELLNEVIKRLNENKVIGSIRTGGQTGFDEAGAKAGMRLGIPTKILAPKGWVFRDVSGKDISNQELFKERFLSSPYYQEPNIAFYIAKNDLKGVLNSIINAKNKYSGYASYIKDKVAGLKITFSTEIEAYGWQAEGITHINPNYIKEDSDLLHEVILHELTHALTAAKIDAYEAFNERGDNSLLDRLNKTDIDAMDSIRGLMNSVRKKLENNNEMTKYAFSTMKEFVTYSMTNAEFQALLNKEQFGTSNKTLFDRFIELIQKLLGMKVERGSVLEATAKEVINLIDSAKTEGTDFTTNLFPAFVNKRNGYEVSATNRNPHRFLYDDIEDLEQSLGLANWKVTKKADGTPINQRYYITTQEAYKKATRLLKVKDLFNQYTLVKAISNNEAVYRLTPINKAPVFKKTTGDIGLDKILRKWENQLRILERQVRGTPDEKAAKQREADELKKKIAELLDKKSAYTVFERANVQLKQVQELLTGPQNQETLQKAAVYIDGWLNIQSLFAFEEDSAEHKAIGRIVANAALLKNKLQEKEREYFMQLANYERPASEQLSYKQLFEAQLDTNYFSSRFLDASVSSVAIEHTLQKWIKDAQFEINSEATKAAAKIAEEVEKLGGKAEFKTLLQEYENGELTGNLISEYKQEYYDKIKELSEAAKSDPKQWKQYWAWVNSTGYKLTTKEALANKSKHFSDSELAEQRELLDQYTRDLAAFKAEERIRLSYSELYLNKDKDEHIKLEFERNLQENIDAWEKANSPYLREQYESEVQSGKRRAHDLRGMGGYKYLLHIKPKEAWLDPKFKALNDKQRAFLDFFKNTVREYAQFLPESADLQSNTIPELAKTFREYIITEGASKMFSYAKDNFIRSITTDDLSNVEYGIIDEETGKPISELVATMVPKKGREKMAPKAKSTDLERVLNAYVNMAASIKYKSAIESKLLLGQRILNSTEEQLANSEGAIKDFNGNPILVTKGLRYTKDRVNYLIDTFYGKRKELKGEGKEIQSGPLAGKKLVGSKIGDEINQYTTANGLALNPFSGVTNLFFGLVSNALHAASGEDYGDKEFYQGLGIMASVALPSNVSKTKKKIAALMEKFQILKEINPAAYGEKSVFDKLYFFQKMGEHIIQGNVMVSMMLKKGIWDNYDEEGNWKGEGTEPDEKTLANRIQKVIKYQHGNYDPNSPVLIKKGVWGRMLMVFRNWIPYTLQNRFGKEYFDVELQRAKKGRYLTWNPLTGGTVGFTKGLKALFKLSLVGRLAGQQVEGLSATDVANLKVNLREMSVAASLYLMTMLLRGMIEDDEDDETKAVYTYFLNAAQRVDSDLWFFVSPKAFKQIINDPIPPFRTIDNFVTLIQNTGGWVMGNDEIKAGRNRGDSKVARSFRKSFPILSQFDKTINFSSEVFQSK